MWKRGACANVSGGWNLRVWSFESHNCKKRRGKKEPPLWTVDEGLYWAVALGQNSRGQVSKQSARYEGWGKVL